MQQGHLEPGDCVPGGAPPGGRQEDRVGPGEAGLLHSLCPGPALLRPSPGPCHQERQSDKGGLSQVRGLLRARVGLGQRRTPALQRSGGPGAWLCCVWGAGEGLRVALASEL